MSTTPLRLWPESERPREKLLQLGAPALTEAELLAVLLQNGTPGRSALDTARSLLGEFRSLRGLLSAERAAVCRTPGFGLAKYALLQASLELARRHYAELMQAGPRAGKPPRHAGLPSRPAPGSRSRGVLLPFSRQSPPGHRFRRSFPRDYRRRQCPSPRRREAGVNPECGGRDPCAQSSVRRGGTKPGRRSDHRAAAGRPGAGGHPGAGPHRRRGWRLRLFRRAGAALTCLNGAGLV